MGKRGKLYPPEFKEEAVRLVRSSDEKYPVAKSEPAIWASPPRRCASGSIRPRSTPESGKVSPPRRKKSCTACAKR
jgi:hypothetical protein